jgi:hypothetical protein
VESKLRAAIVTTLRSPGAPLLSFVDYHLRIGFEHIFLFYEGESDEALARICSNPRVSTIKVDTSLQEEWSALASFRAVRKFLSREVMARQILNAEVAVRRATAAGIQWLLHIDADELLLLGDVPLNEHLTLVTNIGATQVVYANHEAVPESEEIENYFTEVTLFKANPAVCAAGRRELFVAYTSGKAAVRLDTEPIPHGVHRFRPTKGRNRTFRSARNRILHYPSCGFSRFVEKYRILGAFAERWFDQVYIPKAMEFHWLARTLITEGHLDQARQLYRERVMLGQIDEQAREFLLETGALLRIKRPSSLL